MADTDDFRIKGAASAANAPAAPKQAEAKQSDEVASSQVSEASDTGALSPGQIEEAEAETDGKGTGDGGETQEDSQQAQLQRYRWCKCICDPVQYGRDHYYLQMDTQESRWEEPGEPYWLWDAARQTVYESGLIQPTTAQVKANQPDPEYTGYNPKIHGDYDPNAPYAQYHEQKHEQEEAVGRHPVPVFYPPGSAEYGSTGTFNRFTGAYQGGDQSTERHSDSAKSGRQMGAYFDVDAAANAHDGRSLKEERRNEKLSKKQIKELAEKRRAKKEKKRMDFYKS